MELTSIIPPETVLIKEYCKHHNAVIDLTPVHDDYISTDNAKKMNWHQDEEKKIAAVLDALYPDWHKKLRK